MNKPYEYYREKQFEKLDDKLDYIPDISEIEKSDHSINDYFVPFRRKIVAGNWKMNKTFGDAYKHLLEIIDQFELFPNCDAILFPSFPFLYPMIQKVQNKFIKIGAQNLASHEAGAYTGEVSAKMLKSCLIDSVLIGHSERRHIFGENDETIAKKINEAFKEDLTVFLCIGENEEERKTTQTGMVLARQLKSALTYDFEIDKDKKRECLKKLKIAYEPIWAIGTGKTATAFEAEEAASFIREILNDLLDDEIAMNAQILYGGSVNENNFKDIVSQFNIDGALIGNASLEVESFIKMIKLATKTFYQGEDD